MKRLSIPDIEEMSLKAHLKFLEGTGQDYYDNGISTLFAIYNHIKVFGTLQLKGCERILGEKYDIPQLITQIVDQKESMKLEEMTEEYGDASFKNFGASIVPMIFSSAVFCLCDPGSEISASIRKNEYFKRNLEWLGVGPNGHYEPYKLAMQERGNYVREFVALYLNRHRNEKFDPACANIDIYSLVRTYKGFFKALGVLQVQCAVEHGMDARVVYESFLTRMDWIFEDVFGVETYDRKLLVDSLGCHAIFPYPEHWPSLNINREVLLGHADIWPRLKHGEASFQYFMSDFNTINLLASSKGLFPLEMRNKEGMMRKAQDVFPIKELRREMKKGGLSFTDFNRTPVVSLFKFPMIYGDRELAASSVDSFLELASLRPGDYRHHALALVVAEMCKKKPFLVERLMAGLPQLDEKSMSMAMADLCWHVGNKKASALAMGVLDKCEIKDPDNVYTLIRFVSDKSRYIHRVHPKQRREFLSEDFGI